MLKINSPARHGLNIIIVGCGKVGTTLVQQLCKEGHKITIVDKDPSTVQELTNLYDIIKEENDGIISTETLGMAFEPEQKYENPDGSPIIFNQDFFGNHRDVKTVAGPFTDKKASEQKLF